MFFLRFAKIRMSVSVYIYNKKMKKGKVEKTALSFGSNSDGLVLRLGDRCGNSI